MTILWEKLLMGRSWCSGPPPDFLSRAVALINIVRFSLGKPHTWSLLAARSRKSGYSQKTNLPLTCNIRLRFA
jgi:hypothetical protein